ncbi:amino acid ABC transporter permease [Deinococcus yavapaiensis]|uniref:Amino acid ABC transporter membrane protein (PAAT family) n=1 Tax=Deinococcus yavapaiensis KR-236 TaxID=694435 RepID=A0A318SC11_9DEIO|nr:amino acid ABC transporter permease [Deinococcus yavapaiensis]PYE56548.1 amino acid ABC transporter membrane protein (PAAT family) [Deinococcus yavapaiensis KR-236]
MTAASPRRFPAPLVALFWVAVGVVTFYLLFWLVSLVLSRAPEPIGSRANLFVEGARITLLLTLVSGVIGLIVGMLVGLARTSGTWFLRGPASFFVWIIRGTPLLVQILFVYNALPILLQQVGVGAQLNEFWSAVIALSLNVGAYNAEVIRAGILAVPRGQTEAARSLGLSGGATMTTVVLPQALRIVVPPLVNNVVALLKDSSLASSIALLELTLAGSRVSSETFLPVPVLTTVAAVYLLLTTVLTFFTDLLERRLKLPGR